MENLVIYYKRQFFFTPDKTVFKDPDEDEILVIYKPER